MGWIRISWDEADLRWRGGAESPRKAGVKSRSQRRRQGFWLFGGAAHGRRRSVTASVAAMKDGMHGPTSQ
jgi:hypothetical protein